ncbi:MAG: hypothetical protein H5T86_15475 [Armatimonadetes bacterium]|nr:hypothetical protein [Armatimonadota bacterium]
MTRLMAVGENDLLLDSLRAATDLATKHASAAKVSLKEAKMRAARAEVRVSIAAVNLASLGATPEEMDAIAQIIAYFAGTAPSRVIKLMEEHRIGPGEAAACLIAARSTHGSADQLAKMGAERGDFVQFLERGKDCLLGSQILLRFMAQAVAKELPTASHEPPQFTS